MGIFALVIKVATQDIKTMAQMPGQEYSPLIAVVGVNHHTSPIEIREQLSFTPAETSDFLRRAKRNGVIKGGVLISTCNRTELYAESELQAHEFEEHIIRLMLEYKQLPIPHKRYFSCKKDTDAIETLFLTASGYLSMVRGETQILSQIKSALQIARTSDNCTNVLIRLFDKALEVSKRVRSMCEIAPVQRSAGAAAVALLKEKCGKEQLQQGRHLIIGAGQMAETLVRALQTEGVEESLCLYNRTEERAKRFANTLKIPTTYFGQKLNEALATTNYIWVATAASSPIITVEVHQALLQAGTIIFDLGLPRNVAPEVAELKSITLYCIDDLADKGAVQVQLPTDVRKYIKEAIKEFLFWRDSRWVSDIFAIIRMDAEELVQRELEKVIEDHDDHTQELLRDYSKQLTNAYASTMIARLRKLSEETKDPSYAEVMKQLLCS